MKAPKAPKALHINLFGGPGIGKSTTRSQIFYELKKRNLIIEEIVEFAKTATYKKDYVTLSDQIYVFGQQHHMHHVLDNQVDYVVTDSPFLMGLVYTDQSLNGYNILKKLMITQHKSYDTLNILLTRDHAFQDYGRTQNEEQSIKIHNDIKNLLDKANITYEEISSSYALTHVLNHIENFDKKRYWG